MLEEWRKTTISNTVSHIKKRLSKSGSHMNIWVTKHYRQGSQGASRLWDWCAEDQHTSHVTGAECGRVERKQRGHSEHIQLEKAI